MTLSHAPDRRRSLNTADSGWRSRSACRDADPDLFFPTGTAGQVALQQQRALALCRACPVVADCRAHALRLGVLDGIWGGLLPEQRRSARRPAHDPGGHHDSV